jgi:hypothetical protein
MSEEQPSVHERLRRLVSAIEAVDMPRNDIFRPGEPLDPTLSAAMEALDGCRRQLVELAAPLALELGVGVP